MIGTMPSVLIFAIGLAILLSLYFVNRSRKKAIGQMGTRCRMNRGIVYQDLDPILNENIELRKALEESVKLQSHYAQLLNMHDGGSRMEFKTAYDWMICLKEVEAKQRREAACR